jgi:hypothetical protein
MDLLREQVRCGGPSLRLTLISLQDSLTPRKPEGQPDEKKLRRRRAGLGIHWKQAGRYPVRYIAASSNLSLFLHELLTEDTSAPNTKCVGWQSVWEALDIAKAWGFRRAFVLVDGIDNMIRDKGQMIQLLLPLFQQFDYGAERKLFFKMFLPLEIRKEIKQTIRLLPFHSLKTGLVDATIKWTPDALRQILIQRFRAAGSQVITSLDILAEKDQSDGFEKAVITAADGSPRKMLMIISAMIDMHIARAPGDTKFSLRDFENALEIVNLQLGESP